MDETLVGLEQTTGFSSISAMKLILATATYVVMGAILALGIVLAVKGSVWLLVLGLIVFTIIFGKIGCLQ